MKSWQAAHLRMLEILPKRTHRRREGLVINEKGVLVMNGQNGGGRVPVPVRVGGVSYPTMTEAAKAMGATRCKIVGMLRRGEAEYG